MDAVLLLVASFIFGLTSVESFSAREVYAVDMRQENAFLRLGGIKGRAITKGFENSIVVTTMAYGIQQAGQWNLMQNTKQ
jgi:hypothetical protein